MGKDKNNFDEEFPDSLDEVITKCKEQLGKIETMFSDKDCKTLGEFYHNSNNTTKTLFDVFKSSNYPPNVISENSKGKKSKELKGLYLFGEVIDNKTIPVYVGISQNIYRRLNQHGWCKTHYEATLAYAMAALSENYKGKRKDLEFKEIEEFQKQIQNFKVAIIPEKIDYDLYFMEVYIAGALKTKWNSFKTH